MTARIVVTGAQGFVGRHLVDQLLARPGIEVLGIGRSSNNRTAFTHEVHWGPTAVRAPLWHAARERLASARYRYRRLDVRDTPALVRLLGEFAPTCIVHLAAALRDQPLDELLASNVGAAASLLEALVGAQLEGCRVVLGSTGGVYGAVAPSALPLHEDHRGTPIDVYSLTKQASEGATRILAERHGLRVVWARLFNLVGPGQEERHFFGRVAAQLTAIGAGLRPPEIELGALDTTRDFLDVRDAAEALWLLACHGEAGLAYNVASGRETRISDALAMLLEVAELGVPVELRHVAPRARDVPRQFGDIARLRGLGFAPRIDLRDSARDLVGYYRREVGPACTHAVATHAQVPLTVSVTTRDDYAIEVVEDGLAQLPDRLRSDFTGRRMALLTDSRVWDLHGRAFLDRMRAAGLSVEPLIVPEGERLLEALALQEEPHARAIAQGARAEDRRAMEQAACARRRFTDCVDGNHRSMFDRRLRRIKAPHGGCQPSTGAPVALSVPKGTARRLATPAGAVPNHLPTRRYPPRARQPRSERLAEAEHRLECYHRPMTRSEILSFAGRDWAAIEEEKARFWVERKRAMTPAEALAAADSLRRFARRVKPDWPDDDERAADLDVHVRVGEALRAVSGHRPR